MSNETQALAKDIVSTLPAPAIDKSVLGGTGGLSPKVAYVLYYRSGNHPVPQAKHFMLATTNIREVIERTKRHCDLIGVRFVQVRPFWTDLEQEEKAMMRGEQV